MIIAIFGIQRSGKTSLINELCASDPQKIFHVKPATKTLELFQQMYGQNRSISTITFKEQETVTSAFKNYLEEQHSLYNVILCDCHYGYRESNGEYKEIHDNSFFEIFDYFIYLDTDIYTIHQRMLQTNGQKASYNFTIQELKKYRDFELNGIKRTVKQEKLLIVTERNQIEKVKNHLFM